MGPGPDRSATPDTDRSAAPDTDRSAAPDTDRSAAPDTDRSAAPHVRLFVALELPAPVAAALAAFRDAADPAVWRPVPTEALHLTLAFLGRRPADDVATVRGVLEAAAGPAPRMSLGEPLLLPPRRARVLAVSLADPDGTLSALHARVSAGLAAAGVYTPETRPFRAHATVARIRPRERARPVSAALEPLEFHGGPLTLFESRLHPHGARYEALSRVPLR